MYNSITTEYFYDVQSTHDYSNLLVRNRKKFKLSEFAANIRKYILANKQEDGEVMQVSCTLHGDGH